MDNQATCCILNGVEILERTLLIQTNGKMFYMLPCVLGRQTCQNISVMPARSLLPWPVEVQVKPATTIPPDHLFCSSQPLEHIFKNGKAQKYRWPFELIYAVY